MSEPIDITPAIQQRLAWDIIDCEEIDDMWRALDLIAPSEDVAEIAHEESHERMATVRPLALMGEVYLVLSADIISKVMAKHFEQLSGRCPSEEEQKVMKMQNQEVIRGAMWPIIAHLLETGMLALGPASYQQTSMRLI